MVYCACKSQTSTRGICVTTGSVPLFLDDSCLRRNAIRDKAKGASGVEINVFRSEINSCRQSGGACL